MNELYLILHKCRDEPALDVAVQTEIAGEAAWIVASSGHRAYPIAEWALSALDHNRDLQVSWRNLPLTPDWYKLRDHYAAPEAPRRAPKAPKVPSEATAIRQAINSLTPEDLAEILAMVNK